jgi:hypothetical protein
MNPPSPKASADEGNKELKMKNEELILLRRTLRRTRNESTFARRRNGVGELRPFSSKLGMASADKVGGRGMKGFPVIEILLGVMLFVSSCVNPEDNYDKGAAGNKPVKDIYNVTVNLPEKDGKELIEANCVICHSLRYIEMQPEMTRKSWEKTVSKMIKNFGAPVKDSLVEKRIVDYLVAIRGKK